MRNNIPLILLISILIHFSCNQNSIIEEPSFINRDTIFDIDQHSCNYYIEFSKVVEEYIHQVDGYFFDKEHLYYSIYFYQNDSTNFFTIWSNILHPSHLHVYNSSNFKFINDTIINRKIVYVLDGNKMSLVDSIFNDMNFSVSKEKETISEKPYIYDGSLYPKTYVVKYLHNKILIELSDTLIVHFLGDGYIEYEKRLIEH